MKPRRDRRARAAALALLAARVLALAAARAAQTPRAGRPHDQRGRHRRRAHRARTTPPTSARVFWNFGMVGDYPPIPATWTCSVFHSVEVPKGTGMNYCDGITPFVLAKIQHARRPGPVYIMETGFRERQADEPVHQPHHALRAAARLLPARPDDQPRALAGDQQRSAHLARTLARQGSTIPTIRAGAGAGTATSASARRPTRRASRSWTTTSTTRWHYYPDSARHDARTGSACGSRCAASSGPIRRPATSSSGTTTSPTRAPPTTTTTSSSASTWTRAWAARRCRATASSSPTTTTPFFDKSSRPQPGLHLGQLRPRRATCSATAARTGYLGYAYLETPGNPFDGIDNDDDGITDEQRDGGPGTHIIGPGRDPRLRRRRTTTSTKFEAAYGPLEKRPAYRVGRRGGPATRTWTGRAEFNDVGADGVAGHARHRRGRRHPDRGRAQLRPHRPQRVRPDRAHRLQDEPHQGRRRAIPIRPPTASCSTPTARTGRERLYEQVHRPGLGGALRLGAGVATTTSASCSPRDRSSSRPARPSASAWRSPTAPTSPSCASTVKTVQQIYNANYQFAVPPPRAHASPPRPGTGSCGCRGTTSPSAASIRSPSEFDFEGYRIYRSTDPDFLDPQVITDRQRHGPHRATASRSRSSTWSTASAASRKQTIDGVAYWLGDGHRDHAHLDRHHGRRTASSTTTRSRPTTSASTPACDSLASIPSENAIAVSRTPRGGLILPKNVVRGAARTAVPGFAPAHADERGDARGRATGIGHGRRGGGELGRSCPTATCSSHVRDADPDSVRADALLARRQHRRRRRCSRPGTRLRRPPDGPVGAGCCRSCHAARGHGRRGAAPASTPGSPTNATAQASAISPCCSTQPASGPAIPTTSRSCSPTPSWTPASRIRARSPAKPAKFRSFAHDRHRRRAARLRLPGHRPTTAR